MVTKSCVSMVVQMFTAEYPKMTMTEERKQLWMQLLDGIGNEVIEGAALHILSTRSDWPPDIALLRCTALSIASGELAALTGAESWASILALISGKEVALTQRERTAMDSTGSLYDLKRSNNIAADRARYIDAYDALATRAKQTRELLPAVARLNERYQDAPELPAPVNEPALPAPDADRPATDEERMFYTKQIRENLGMDPFKEGEES